jgi:hypothetical protein
MDFSNLLAEFQKHKFLLRHLPPPPGAGDVNARREQQQLRWNSPHSPQQPTTPPPLPSATQTVEKTHLSR